MRSTVSFFGTVWRALRPWLRLWVPMTMVALIAVMADFLSNNYEASAENLILPAILTLLVATLVAAVFYRRWRRDPLGAYTSALLATILLGYGYDQRLSQIYPVLQALVPASGLNGAEGPILSLLFIASIFTGTYWIGRLLSHWVQQRHWKSREIIIALTIAITSTFLFQFIPTARTVILAWPQYFYQPPKLATASTAQPATKPDIYYIVLDRYASQSVLQQQFNFDNSDFINFLTSLGYYTNPDAHNNYPYTTQSIASTMDADYLHDIVSRFGQAPQQTTVPYQETIRNSPVAQALQTKGYQYDLVGNWYETSNLSEVANITHQEEGLFTFLGHTFTLDNFDKIKLSQSIFWRFIPNSNGVNGFQWLHYSGLGGVDMTSYQLRTLNTLASQNSGGRFIFAHILVPHDPYYLNADGSLNPNIDSNNTGEPVKQKYLNQVQYINGQMRSLLTTINQKSDGKAVVVLQADEGPYPFQINDENFDNGAVDEELANGDMRSWSNADLLMKFGNLAAYHVPAADLAANPSSATSVNIFRTILNSYFDAQLPILSQCYYAYPNGRAQPEYYADITSRLTGQANPACQSDGAGPK